MAGKRRARPLLAVAALVGMAALLPATAATSTTTTTTTQPGTAGGRELYLRSCAWCHGQDAAGTQRGPGLIGVGAASTDFQLTTGRMPLASEDATPRRQEPAFTPEQIDALVAYVASLGPGGEPLPQVNADAGDLSRGLLVYQNHCAACHSATGTGAALTGGKAAPPLDQATALQVAESARVGPGTMPRFSQGVIDDRDMDDLARYVAYLQDRGNPGGWSLGRVGPVTEGLVGWLLGLGGLLLVIRALGRRAPPPRKGERR